MAVCAAEILLVLCSQQFFSHTVECLFFAYHLSFGAVVQAMYMSSDT